MVVIDTTSTPSSGAYVDLGGAANGPTYHHSSMPPRTPESSIGGRLSVSSASRLSATSGGAVFVRGSMLARDIEAVTPAAEAKPERTRDYKGRRRTWPGLMFLVLLLGAGACLGTYFALKDRSSRDDRATAYEKAMFNAMTIRGGNETKPIVGEEIVEKGVIGNPKKYPKSVCELPDYQSKNGHIVAVAANGTEVPLKIKGINWFGMEGGQAAPFGLWGNSENGTTAYQVASFLSRNKFNAVRLPLMVESILKDRAPNAAIINNFENLALNVTSYMGLLKGIVKTLQYRHIGVLISMHTLNIVGEQTKIGEVWFNEEISEEMFLESIDILTRELCSSEYWNIIGIDLKNEPSKGTWGDGGPRDFRAGAKRIADRMLKGCPNWMGFVEGINAQHSLTIDGEAMEYFDWYGGGLHGARSAGLEFSTPNKVVWAPHYYTPAVFVKDYFYEKLTRAGDLITGFVELGDDKLRRRIQATMDDMFGFLASETGPALLLGEFGGLYREDKHPMNTTKRCTDFTIEIIKQPGWAGGFVWSLNPESEYQYNPADTPGRFFEGVLETDWLHANADFLNGMAAMDDMEGLQPFPCFQTRV